MIVIVWSHHDTPIVVCISLLWKSDMYDNEYKIYNQINENVNSLILL